MRPLAILTVVAFLVVTAGCGPADVSARQKAELNAWLVESLRDAGIENAIVRQHTVYPYQFTPNSAELNELGRRDLNTLATHYRDHPGQLTIRKGQASQELYKARATTVLGVLADEGVDTASLAVSDGLPGGEGMGSAEVVIHFNRDVLGAESGNSAQSTEAADGKTGTKEQQ